MHVAITADPYIPVPPQLYGGIERVIDFLIRGLVDRGHRVTLIAHPESDTPARLIPFGAPPHFGLRPRARELCQAGRALWQLRRDVDLVHSYGRLAALLPILPLRGLPKIQSYQRDQVPWRGVKTAVLLGGRSVCFTACGSNVYSERPGQGRLGGEWHTIFNGVPIDRYRFAPGVPDDAPLAFLGRIEEVKGVHRAIQIARGSGRRLLIAGNRADSGPHADYFEQQISPELDGQNIRYIGPVDDAQKNELLGSAAALLMPILWEEPFGIVMAEAMACGTPVIGFPRGSVPEVVRDGVNGFSCKDTAEAIDAVGRLGSIDRAAVRADCEARFSDTVIVDAYEALYHRSLERA